MTPRLIRQIGWAKAEAERQRRLVIRNNAAPRAREHARRMAALADATVADLTALAGRASPAPYPNRLKLWMPAPDAAQFELENAQ